MTLKSVRCSLSGEWTEIGRAHLANGDCRTVMAEMPASSVDAIVTDPPYGLEFMGKDWDRPWATPAGGAPVVKMVALQAWFTEVAELALRVLKPGGYLLAFGGTRTSHRIAVAIEDAGFEIRDTIEWMYGSGFPKSMDVSKAIDKAAGAERTVLGERVYADGHIQRSRGTDLGSMNDDGWRPTTGRMITAPGTDGAKQWEGWGTALKPAHEPIIMARKPFGGTVANNVLTHGTGAINVDASRVGSEGTVRTMTTTDFGLINDDGWQPTPGTNGSVAGRFPANVILSHGEGCVEIGTRTVKGSRIEKPAAATPDARVAYGAYGAPRPARGHGDADGTETIEAWECVQDCPVRMLDEQTATLQARGNVGMTKRSADGDGRTGYGSFAGQADVPPGDYGGSGGASRFFYCAKTSKSERSAGLPAWPEWACGLCSSTTERSGQWIDRRSPTPQDPSPPAATDGMSPPRATSEDASTDEWSLPTSTPGSSITAQCPTGSKSTTETRTSTTTTSPTSNSSLQLNTSGSTADACGVTTPGGSPANSAANSNPSTSTTGTSVGKGGPSTGDVDAAIFDASSKPNACGVCGSEEVVLNGMIKWENDHPT